MLTARLQLQAEKSQGYMASLARHFGRKVRVDEHDDHAVVYFPGGTCVMRVVGQVMHFEVQADEEESLELIKSIVDSHALRYGELKQVQAVWQ